MERASRSEYLYAVQRARSDGIALYDALERKLLARGWSQDNVTLWLALNWEPIYSDWQGHAPPHTLPPASPPPAPPGTVYRP